MVEAEHTVLPWLSTLRQRQLSSSCSGMLPSEQVQPTPVTLHQGAAREPAAAGAEAGAWQDLF